MNRNFWAAALLLPALLAGCVQTEANREASANDAEINRYVTARGLSPLRTPSGLYYQFLAGSSTPQPLNAGDRLTFTFRESRLIDGAGTDSSLTGQPLYYSWGANNAYRSDTSFTRTKAMTPGLIEGLKMMPVGSQALFLMPASLAYGETGQRPYILPYFTVRNDVTLLAVETEVQQVDAAFSRRGLVPQVSLDNGFRMTYTERPAGTDSLRAGSRYRVAYTGSLTNGKVFDSGTLTVNMSNPGLVAGFVEALKRLTVGQAATAGFPSELGYGKTGSLPRLPPYAPLLFTIKVTEKVE